MSNVLVGKSVDTNNLPAAIPTGGYTRLATDAYGRLITNGVNNGTTQIVDSNGTAVSISASSDGYALEVEEQFASVAEDNINGVIAIAYKPIANSSYAVSYASTTALATNIVIKGSPGKLFKISGYVNQTDGYATQHWIQIHNAVSLPADTAIPLFSFPIDTRATAGPIAFEYCFYDLCGLYANTGLVAAISKTGPSLTIATVYTAWFNCSFI